ncbi:MAG: MG2 domain-containing protein [Armatimonadota bacterium]
MSGRIITGAKAFFITLFIIAWIGVLFALVIAKEVPTGTVTGTVVHRDKEVYKGTVANAKVVISSGNVLKRTVTDENGQYKFTDLPAGADYWISATATGLVSWSEPQIVVREGKTTKAKPIVMATRPPDISASLYRTVFVPGEKVLLNIRGYSKTDTSAHISVFRMNVKAMQIERNSNYNVSLWNYTDPEPILKMDKDLKKDAEGFFDDQASISLNDEGGYLVRTSMGKIGRDIWFVISNLALINKQSKSKNLTYCVDFTTKKPVEGAVVTAYNNREVRWTGTTDSSGLLMLPTSGNTEGTLITAEKGSSFASTNNGYYRDNSTNVCYMHTDRPVYRPGHKVYFKGIVRKQFNNFYRNVPGEKVPIDITDATGKKIKHLDLVTNDYGSFSGEFNLSDKASLGNYQISAILLEDDFSVSENRISFQVAEYRKPEYQVSLSFDKKYFIAGSPIKATVQASYYFGAPVVDADVKYTVYRSPAYYSDYGDDCCDGFYDEFDSEYNGEYGYGEYIMEATGRTDSQGRLLLEIPTDKSVEGDSTYEVEINVTDQSLRTIGASGSVFVPKGLFRLVANTSEYIYRPNDQVKIDIKAVDHEDRPRGNVKTTVRIDESIWEGNNNRFKHVISGEVTTQADGTASYTYSPEKEGNFRVTVEARDRMGNLIKGETYVWVAGDDFQMYGYKGAELEIVRDKKVYQVGDTARVIINSSVSDVYALLTVEGTDIHQHQVIYLKSNSTVVELEALEAYVPNAFISVCLVDKSSFVNNQVPFNVSPEFKFMNVNITSDKEVYKPGDTAKYTIKTTDLSGEPVSAEISLGIVDESIYAIMEDRTEDIRKFFYGPRGNAVSTAYSFPDYYMGGADKEGFDGKVRKNFPDTAYWSPDVQTDSNGQAVISMQVPDNLTTWRATARAVTKGTDVGSTVQKVRATKDLIVRLQTPRFFTQKDELSIGAALHNYTKKRQQVRLRLDVKGLEIKGKLDRTVTIDPDDIMRFEWPVTANQAGTAMVTVYAQGETDSDAVEMEVPVLPHGLNKIRTANGSVDKQEQVKINIPRSAIPETVRMEVHVMPTAAGMMLSSLKYLADYPYGCVEQTMSRFLPTVIVADTLKSLGRREPSLEKELPKMVKAGLTSLYDFQNPDGGWGWWEDESSPFTTAYVVYGLTHAKNAGYAVNSDVLIKGLESLKAQLERIRQALQVQTPDKPPFASPTERIYMLYALALNDQADARHVLNIYNNRKNMNVYGRAILALTLYEMGDRTRADRVTGELESQSKLFKGMRHWDAEEGWDWDNNSVEATAYGLRAMIRRNPQSPKVEEIVRWLTMKRSGDRWTSTKDTAAVVYALAEYVRSRPEFKNVSYTADISVNGKKQKSIAITSDDIWKKEIVIPVSRDAVKEGENTVTITKNGAGPLYYSTVLRYFSLEEDIKPYASGMNIKREYFRLVPVRDANGVMSIKPRPIGRRVSIGDRILCRLTINSNDNYHYVVIEDPRLAGWESMEQLSDGDSYGGYESREEGWLPWTRREYRDEKVAIFATRLPKGKWVAEYFMRAEIPGEFHSLPTTAYGMYAPQANGNGAERRVRVR